MAQYPKIAESPLELFCSEEREVPLLNKFWGPLICGTILVSSTMMANLLQKRPAMSGVQRHVIAGGIGLVVGKLADDYRTKHYAERDAVFRHYISLHPDDFPPFERKKFADVLDEWIPIR